MKVFWKVATRRHILTNALKIALVVGTILNLINQGSLIFAGGPVSWLHIILNYVVPFCVATYSATRIDMTREDQK